MMKHTGEKPYICTERSKAFTRSSYFKEHQGTHLKEKPYECTECNKAFALPAGLRNHTKMHKNRKRKNTVICTWCDKAVYDLKIIHKNTQEKNLMFALITSVSAADH